MTADVTGPLDATGSNNAQRTTHTTVPPAPDYKTLFESAPGLYLVLTPQLVIVAVSDAYLKATMTRREEIVGRGLFEVFPENSDDLRASLERVRQERVADAMPAQQHDIRRPESGGGGFEARYWSRVNPPVLSPDGSLAHIIHRVEDVTELQLARVRQDQLAAQLQETNQELESFSSAVSHDLRAPLRRISGFGELLQEECGSQLDARGQDYLRRIDKATRNMGQLIEDLLQLLRATRGELQHAEVDLSQLAQAAVEELRKADGERAVDIVIQNGVVASGDARLLRTVLDKLLGNAWKYTRNTARPRIEFGAEVVDHETRYFVRDNGVGFDMAQSDRLFRPFHRLHTEAEFPGSGIGLATVKRIVSRHGGRVWGESVEGRGARFYFQLPESRA